MHFITMAENFNVQDIQNEGAYVQRHSEDASDATTFTSNTQTNADDSPPKYWQIGQKTLSASMIEVHKNNLWTDFTIYCGKNKEEPLKAHKIILAARSPFFEALLFGPVGKQKSEQKFSEANTDTFNNMLRFLYYDDVRFSNIGEAIELMETANQFLITSLEDFCAHYLQTHITPEDACMVLNIAIKFNKMDLKESCCHFIDRNADAVLQSDEFLNISPEVVNYILKADTFWANNDVIVQRMEDWEKHRPNELEKARLSIMSNNPRIVPDAKMIIREESFGKENCTDFRQALLVGVRREVYLTSLCISHIGVFLQYNSRLYTSKTAGDSRFATVKHGQLLPKSLPVTLDVTILVDQLEFKECFLVEQKEGDSELTLTKPLLLEKQQAPYKLEVDIKLVSNCSSIKLAGKVGTVEQTFLQWGEKKYISVSQAETSMLGIKWIQFTNCSLREDNDITNDWSKLDAFLSDGDNENTENTENVGNYSESRDEESD